MRPAVRVNMLDRLHSASGHAAAAGFGASGPTADRSQFECLTKSLRKQRALALSLARNGYLDEALAVLKRAARKHPRDLDIARWLSNALAAKNRPKEALAALRPGLKIIPADLESLRMAAVLNRRLGNTMRALRLSREVRQRNPRYLREVLSFLVAANRRDEALTKSRNLFASDSTDPRDYFACYTVFLRCGANQDQIDAACERVIACAEANGNGNGPYWRVRLLREQGQLPAASEQLDDMLATAPENAGLIKERAICALAEGHWGRDAAILANARARAAPFSPLSCGIARADRLLMAFGGSLEKAARYPQLFDHVKAPESVFEYVCRQPAPAAAPHGRRGIAMVIGSLAAGGAERVQATLFRHLGDDPELAPAKLYVCDLAHETGKDFHLTLTGHSASDIVVMDRECHPDEPLSWLPRWYGQTAGRILERLKQDRPAILHAALEPLNLLAAFAGVVAGVPRIFMHTHNMRPTELAAGGAWMRECYRALLKRPEVSLISCARASARDYAEWLGLDDASAIHVVHNGCDAAPLIEADCNNSRADLRRSHGIAPGAAVVGTAFRFVELKQPYLWVEAASEVLRHHPECHFVMFGDGELRAATQDYIRSKGLADRFSLPGCVTDLARQLPMLDLFVLSSRTEALPNVLLEAQAARVPVISFDVGGVRETMIDGVTGILAGGHSAEALAAEVVWALDAPGWRTSAGSAGQAFVKDAFSAETMVRNLKNIFLRRPDTHTDRKEVSYEVAA